MRVASFTMVGQFPEGIATHVRNLRWALTPDDHVYVVTLPEIISGQGLVSDDRVSFVPFVPGEVGGTGFINFWAGFPGILTRLAVDPEWFLFMEQDIWYFSRPRLPQDRSTIRGGLPPGDYRNILVGGRPFHNRVWEGAQLVHGSVVKSAVAQRVDFSMPRSTFLDRDRSAIEERVGGAVTLTKPGPPDTMDEFSLFCALVAGTNLEHDVKASHLRGPESIARRFPDVPAGCSPERLAEVQRSLPYFDVLLAVAVFYVVGTWKEEPGQTEWKRLRPDSLKELVRIRDCGQAWLTADEHERLKTVLTLCCSIT